MCEIADIKSYYEKRSLYHATYLKVRNARTVELLSFIDVLDRDPGFRSALDIGCGVGITSEHLRRCCKDVTATDLSDTAIEIARERNLYSDVNYLAGDFTRMKLGRKFDLVCLFDVLEHIRPGDRDAFLENVKDHCEGVIAISVPDPENTRKLKESNPGVLQIVDEEIRDEHLKGFSIEAKVKKGVYVYYVIKELKL